jgi:2-amino-4-hydroxy-6-hydroxymethyldihydropteridine diphosphokinase
MILIAVGANLPGPAGPPLQNCEAALAALAVEGVRIVARSRWYRTPPWPVSDQPWYVNAVVAAETALDPPALLALLHKIEARLGRERTAGTVNAARPLDLDLIDYEGLIREAPPPALPHPRLEGRAFVLRPLSDIAPNWRHPKTGRSLKDLLAELPADAIAEPIAAGAGGEIVTPHALRGQKMP